MAEIKWIWDKRGFSYAFIGNTKLYKTQSPIGVKCDKCKKPLGLVYGVGGAGGMMLYCEDCLAAISVL